ncbi:MAG: hypothetical protein C0467_21585 [Planctomycetaceae bacterium]|nr:hypothetical protein [Planctomycetaceae bacterium]
MAKDSTTQPDEPDDELVDDESIVTGGPKAGDPVSDWRVINKKADSDNKQWEDAMRDRKAKGLPEMPLNDWLKLQHPLKRDQYDGS